MARFRSHNGYRQYNSGSGWNYTHRTAAANKMGGSIRPGYHVHHINGVKTGRSDFGGVSKVKEFLRLSCEVDGSEGRPNLGWSGRIDLNNGRMLPADFIVDYVRVYQFNEYMPAS